MDIFTEFRKDSVYEPFLSDEFDVQAHTSELVQGVVIADHLHKLSLGLSRVETELEHHVGDHYKELLSQAAGIDKLENSLTAIQTRTQTLQAGVERVRARIVEPFDKLQHETLVLARLQCTCELLRRVIRCLAVTKKLRVQLSNCPRELTKAATSISELEDLYSDGELSGLHVLEGSELLMRDGRTQIEKQAKEMLQSGAVTHNQTTVGTGLQVFHNLGSLGPSVEKVVQELLESLHQTISSALDTSAITSAVNSASNKKGAAPGRSVLPALGQTSQFRAVLWSSLEKMMDEIYNTVLQTHHLHKVLVKKKDPVTHVVFLDEVERHCSKDLFTRVWTTITSDLTRHFSKAASGSHFIRQALEVDYPKLVRLYGDLWRRLESITGEMRRNAAEDSETRNELGDKDNVSNPEALLRESLLPLEAAFLSRSLSRLFDPVNLMFSTPSSPPTKQECDSLIKTIASEVNVSCVDSRLSESVARNVLKCVQLLCSKCEQMMPADDDATQVIGPPTESQQMVVSTVNQLLYLRSQLDRALSATLSHLALSSNAFNTLRQTVPALETVMVAGVSPLMAAITTAIDNILLTMHEEDFSGSDTKSCSPQAQQSLYMKELQSFLSRASSDYLSPFHSSTIIKESVDKISSRCLTMFVWNASLLRPLGEQGKMRLAADFAQLEEGISVLCSKPSDLGNSYRLVRSVRPLLFLTPQHMIQVSSVGDLLPHSLILHFLFSRAPPELKSPHQSANWSVGQYLEWMDKHQSEAERLELIAGTLESYATTVTRTGKTHYATVYPVMMDCLQQGQKRISKKTARI